jgi:predicted GNAT family acetyltransferase
MSFSAKPSAIRDNSARSRFELEADGITVFMNYRLTGTVISLDHTETPVEARGRGLASRLVKGVLDEVRRRGLKMVPRCPFVTAYVAKHPEYRDLAA